MGHFISDTGTINTSLSVPQLSITGTDNATDKETGCLALGGGLGIAKDVYIGDNISLLSEGVNAGQINCLEIITTSDKTFKKDIEVIDNPIDKILQLRGCTYNWRVDEFPEKHFGNELQVGFMAQEVEAVMPEVVKTKPNGYKGIAYDKLTALLVEGMKEQQNTIECLKEEIYNINNREADISDTSSDISPESTISSYENLENENECIKMEIYELREELNNMRNMFNNKN